MTPSHITWMDTKEKSQRQPRFAAVPKNHKSASFDQKVGFCRRKLIRCELVQVVLERKYSVAPCIFHRFRCGLVSLSLVSGCGSPGSCSCFQKLLSGPSLSADPDPCPDPLVRSTTRSVYFHAETYLAQSSHPVLQLHVVLLFLLCKDSIMYGKHIHRHRHAIDKIIQNVFKTPV